MNFLAHIFLSGNDEILKIGNFMGDCVRGNEYLKLDSKIQEGILLHRKIDTFTDTNQNFRNSTKKLHSKYHHYSGVIVDVFYDHFLCKNWSKFSDEDLDIFINNFYKSLVSNESLLNLTAKNRYPKMILYNWLGAYKTIEGIENILTQMDYRTKNNSKMGQAVEELKLFYEDFETDFLIFFNEIQSYLNKK